MKNTTSGLTSKNQISVLKNVLNFPSSASFLKLSFIALVLIFSSCVVDPGYYGGGPGGPPNYYGYGPNYAWDSGVNIDFAHGYGHGGYGRGYGGSGHYRAAGARGGGGHGGGHGPR